MSETKNAKENKNSNLHKAKSAKNDEFYTLYESIQEELNHYTKHFEGKTVLCNCDDPYESNFCLFFLKNFNYLKLKRLICTSYKGSPVVDTQVRLFDDEFDEPMTKECAYVLDVKEIPIENGRGVSDDDIYRLLHKKRNDGYKYCKVPAISVFTNLEIPKRNEELFLYRKYNAEEYPTYDNYDAINVDKVADIPCDYDGVMGGAYYVLG